MKEMWEACRRLGNPERLELLRIVYAGGDAGVTGSEIVSASNLGQAAVSTYLRQLQELGLVRGERSGRQVTYSADWSDASAAVAEIAKMLYDRFVSGSRDTGFAAAFRVFGNDFRLRVIRHVAHCENCSREMLAGVFNRSVRLLTRDLAPAVDGGVLGLVRGEAGGEYRYLPPSDSIAWRVVALRD